jgi:uncharacterized protein involved in outer membrane biogenesis
MRKLWIVVAALLLLMVATLVTAALSLNRLVAANRGRIIDEAQRALGRPVAVSRIGVSLWGGLAVRFEDVRIADDPRFGGEDFVRIATLRVHAKLWPLLHQRFAIDRIVATQPSVSVIRDADGAWNYATLQPLRRHATSAMAAGIVRVATVPAPAAAEPGTPPLPFVVDNLAITDGTCVLVDRTQTPARTIRVAQIDGVLHFTGATAPIEIRLAAAVAAETRNLDVHGSLGPRDQQDGLPLQLDGTLGPLGPAEMTIAALHVVATLTPAQLQVSELTGRTLGAAFTLNGQYPLRADAAVAVRGTVRDLDLAAALGAATGNAARIGGKAHVIIDVRGTGVTREAIEASLAGRVVADINDGVIVDRNIANEVLGKASRLPVIGAVVAEKIKPQYPRLFAEPDTHFETLHGIFTIGEQRAQTDDLAIVTPEYGVRGHGWIGFDGQVDMAGKLGMSKRFSDDVVADVQAAKYLLDDEARLSIPFHLRGELGKAKPALDKDDIMALVQRGAVRGGAKDLLDKFFGKAQATPGETQNLIDRGLRRLFGR